MARINQKNFEGSLFNSLKVKQYEREVGFRTDLTALTILNESLKQWFTHISEDKIKQGKTTMIRKSDLKNYSDKLNEILNQN